MDARLALALALALVAPSGCGGRADRADRAAAPGPAAADRASPAAPVAGPAPLSETEARALVSARLRAAGFRVRHDVLVDGVVLDGWDAERRVGFEYVAGFAGDPAIGRAPAGVLVIPAGDAASVERAVAAFLARAR